MVSGRKEEQENIFTPVPGVVDDTCPKLKGDWLPVIEEV
jgi:hypothetical protein